MNLLLILILGAVGGIISARFLSNKSLGNVWDIVVGVIGGGIGAWSLIQTGIGTGSSNLIYYEIFFVLVGGACLHWIVVLLKPGKK